MKYKNANDVLPETLLAELQKYAAGELLYIPQLKERRKSWGESSGTRQYLRKRNQEIRDRFGQGQTVDELSDAYSLSPGQHPKDHICKTKRAAAGPQIL